MQRLVNGINEKTVLEYAAVADAVSDPQLMRTCMTFILETKDRYIAALASVTIFSINIYDVSKQCATMQL